LAGVDLAAVTDVTANGGVIGILIDLNNRVQVALLAHDADPRSGVVPPGG
jgi:hypothetical protein